MWGRRRLGCLLLFHISPTLGALLPPQSSRLQLDRHVSWALGIVPSPCSSILQLAFFDEAQGKAECGAEILISTEWSPKEAGMPETISDTRAFSISAIPPLLQITILLPERSPWVHTRAAWSPPQQSVAQALWGAGTLTANCSS